MVVSLGVLSVLGTASFMSIRRAMDSMMSERLIDRSQTLAVILSTVLAGNGSVSDEELQRLIASPMSSVDAEQYGVAVFDAQGMLIASTPPNSEVDFPALFAAAKDREAGARADRHAVRGLDSPDTASRHARVHVRRLSGLTDPARTLLVVTSDSRFERVSALTAWLTAAGVLIGSAVTWAAVWYAAGLSLRPLRELSEVAEAFTPEAVQQKTRIESMPKEMAEFERELTAARELLSESLRAQDRLISNVSHELKTPIAVLLTEAETMDATALSAEGARFVRSVREEMLRLGTLIETFVVLSRTRGGKPLRPENRCGLNDAVLDAVSSAKSAAFRQGVGIRTLIADDPVAPMVQGDAELLAAMFSHVLRNCIRFSARGGEVLVEVKIEAAHARVTIRDAGPPIAVDIVSRLFERFLGEASDCNDRRELGLSIAQGIAELHGGTISACNAEPTGCEFTVLLPLHGNAEPASELTTKPSCGSS
jgi:signal transduction histidine kinase